MLNLPVLVAIGTIMVRIKILLIVIVTLSATALSWPAQAASSRDFDRCKDFNNVANAKQNLAVYTRILKD